MAIGHLDTQNPDFLSEYEPSVHLFTHNLPYLSANSSWAKGHVRTQERVDGSP